MLEAPVTAGVGDKVAFVPGPLVHPLVGARVAFGNRSSVLVGVGAIVVAPGVGDDVVSADVGDDVVPA